MQVLVTDIENAKDKKLHVSFDDFIDDVKTQGTVKADLLFQDCGFSVSVTGKIMAKMFVQCNRCLEEFVYLSQTDVNECYYKNNLFSDFKQERELKLDAAGEDLNGKNEIDVKDLIYQSLILSVPNDCVCDINCKGGQIDLENYSVKDQENIEIK